MSEKKFNWQKIADSHETIDWQPNNMAIVEAGTKKITLAKNEDGIFAFAHKCPHASGILGEGFLDNGGNVVCPVHRYRFCLENGRNVTGEGYFLKTYPITEKPDGLYVGFEEKGLFSWL